MGGKWPVAALVENFQYEEGDVAITQGEGGGTNLFDSRYAAMQGICLVSMPVLPILVALRWP